MTAEHAQDTVRVIGLKVRRLRSERGLTLQQVAASTGVSVSMLSMLERGVASPSIGTLVAVSAALGIQMTDLFEEPEQAATPPVRRLAEQVVVSSSTGAIRRLVHHDQTRGIEVVVNEYAPGVGSANEQTHHNGTEFGVVIAGKLTVELAGEQILLNAGDGIAYGSQTPHRMVNNGKTRVRAVWVNVSS